VKTKPPVLIINSYGGSLTLAAKQEGHPIILSLEDKNYGLDAQLANFPDLPHRRWLSDWPLDLDLKDSLVIAHPPCSGFSSQNRSKKVNGRGAGSDAFACTTRLLDYVLPRGPEAVAIESVPAALAGAAHIHDFYGRMYGYDLYRVLQNSASFGVPQWRRRFWAIYVKRTADRPRQFTFHLQHNPRYVGDVLDPDHGDPNMEKSHISRWNHQLKLMEAYGKSEKELVALFQGKAGSFLHIVCNADGVPQGWEARRPFAHKHVVGGHFLSGSLHILGPDTFCPVLMGLAWWWFGNRMVGYDDYKELMGFPRSYIYPRVQDTLCLLSRGVCPPVARWILREMSANVFGIPRPPDEISCADKVGMLKYRWVKTISPGEIADMKTPQELRVRSALS